MITWITISTFVGLCLLIDGVEGGECCRARTGLWNVAANEEMWCEDYCCHGISLGLYCCDDIGYQANSWDRTDLCPDYFSKNVWAPILIALGCIGSIIGCCVCCYYCCCRSNNRTGAIVMAPAGGNPNVTVVNTTNTMTHQPPPMMSMPAGGQTIVGVTQG